MMNFTGYDPYGNQLMHQQSYQPAQNNTGSFITVPVSGEAEAINYPVAAGNTVLLIDFENKVFWLKTTDVNRVPQPMRRFNFEEHIPQPIASEQPVSRKEFDELRKAIKELKELIE